MLLVGREIRDHAGESAVRVLGEEQRGGGSRLPQASVAPLGALPSVSPAGPQQEGGRHLERGGGVQVQLRASDLNPTPDPVSAFLQRVASTVI